MPGLTNLLLSVSAGTILLGGASTLISSSPPIAIATSTIGAIGGSLLAYRKDPTSPELTTLLEQNQAILGIINDLPRELPPPDLGAIVTLLHNQQKSLETLTHKTQLTLAQFEQISVQDENHIIDDNFSSSELLTKALEDKLKKLKDDELSVEFKAFLSSVKKVVSRYSPRLTPKQLKSEAETIKKNSILHANNLRISLLEPSEEVFTDFKAVENYILNIFKVITNKSEILNHIRDEGMELSTFIGVIGNKIPNFVELRKKYSKYKKANLHLRDLLEGTGFCIARYEKYKTFNLYYIIALRNSLPEDAEIMEDLS